MRVFLVVLLLLNIHLALGTETMDKEEKLKLRYHYSHFSKTGWVVLQLRRDMVKEMFFHAYDHYIEKAFPDDEIMPINCVGRNLYNSNRGSIDDPLGNFSLTLIDAADTLVVMGEIDAFKDAVRLIIDNVQFDKNVDVSVFETNIRVIGGLLSSHLFAKEYIDTYNEELLHMAIDLGDRLIKAFNTSTGVPYNKVNLKHGHFEQSSITCTACAGTLLLEFGMLTRLSGNPIYEKLARISLLKLWESRSHLDLIGNTLDVLSGEWSDTYATIGAGSDSFYEYLIKSFLLFGNKEYFFMFQKLYISIIRFLYANGIYIRRDINNSIVSPIIDMLSAFWPGLQALIGDIPIAEANFNELEKIWYHYKGLPEILDLGEKITIDHGYHLRPELIESAYLLYRATKKDKYLQLGKSVIEVLQDCCKTECGFSSLSNVHNRTIEDRMDSYFLSETLKYLYLLFDEDNFVNDGNYIFTTEGHLLPTIAQNFSLTEVMNFPVGILRDPKCLRLKFFRKRKSEHFEQ